MVYFLLASLLFPAGAKQSTQGHHLYMKVLSRIQPPRLYIYIYIHRCNCSSSWRQPIPWPSWRFQFSNLQTLKWRILATSKLTHCSQLMVKNHLKNPSLEYLSTVAFTSSNTQRKKIGVTERLTDKEDRKSDIGSFSVESTTWLETKWHSEVYVHEWVVSMYSRGLWRWIWIWSRFMMMFQSCQNCCQQKNLAWQ